MKTEQRMATLKQIMARLAVAEEDADIDAKVVAQHARVEPSSYSRWKNGNVEGGCWSVTAAGLFLGILPNELYLEDASTVPGDKLPRHDAEALARLIREVVHMRQLTQGGGKSSIRITAEFLAQVNKEMLDIQEDEKAEPIPPGTVIKLDRGRRGSLGARVRRRAVPGRTLAGGLPPARP